MLCYDFLKAVTPELFCTAELTKPGTAFCDSSWLRYTTLSALFSQNYCNLITRLPLTQREIGIHFCHQSLTSSNIQLVSGHCKKKSCTCCATLIAHCAVEIFVSLITVASLTIFAIIESLFHQHELFS